MLYAVCGDQQAAPFVPLVATSEEQARRLLAIVVRYVKRHPALAERARVYSDRIVFPAFDDATVIALPAEAAGLLGLDFSLAILDEIGAMTAATWEAVLTAAGQARRRRRPRDRLPRAGRDGPPRRPSRRRGRRTDVAGVALGSTRGVRCPRRGRMAGREPDA